ncbi:MAG: GntR family transcriptional regulator [Actinobacteria bacterium]|nr:GntR family transcriptional regulator [Actinomycetota bacterium]MDI6830702.1 GntR family transcriptional regulator [Actinomycetota bacterium]
MRRFEIETDSFTPAYFQLAQMLHREVMSGNLRPGDRVPSENELSEGYGVSRMTARRAIELLVEKGVVRREKGRGTFVSRPRIEGGLFLIPDLHDEMRMQGLSSEVRLLGVRVVRAGKTAASRLGIKKGEKVIYLERILEGGDEPLVLDRKYVLLDRSQPLLESELGHGSMQELFAGNPDMAPVRADLKLSATVLSAREAKLLESGEGAPAFCLEQLIFAANDRRVVWGWLIYRGDRFSFESSSRLL